MLFYLIFNIIFKFSEPHIVMHSKSPITVVSETPAHIGWRNEQKTLTTLNSSTGKVEQHTSTDKVPIYGNVQEVIKNLVIIHLFKFLVVSFD